MFFVDVQRTQKSLTRAIGGAIFEFWSTSESVPFSQPPINITHITTTQEQKGIKGKMYCV